MPRDVKIKIGGDTQESEQTIADLKQLYSKTFEDIKRKADRESVEISNSFKRMGLRTEAAIKESTEKAKRDFEAIKRSGTASANDIQRAHKIMTDKIKRNNAELEIANKKFGSSFSGLKTPLQTITKTAAIAGAAIGAIGTAIGVKAFAESVKFESAVLDLQKVLGDGEGSAKDFIKTADQLSEEFGISATDVLAGATNFKQAGFSIKEAFDLQRVAIETAIAGGISVEEASEKISASLKGFGIDASEAGRLTDIFNEISNNFGTNLQEIATGVSILSPVAKQAGLSIEETAGLLTPIIEVFGSGSEAANALRTGIVRLVRPTNETSIALQELGIAETDANGQLRSARDLVFELGEKFKGLTQEQKLQTTAVIFGAEQAARLSTVFSNLEGVTKVVDVAMESAGSRVKEVGVRLSSAEVQIERSRVAFDNAARVIGDQFKDELTGVIGELGNLARNFKELVESGGLEPILENVRPLLDNLKNGISGLAESLPDFINKLGFALEFVIEVVNNIIALAGKLSGVFQSALTPFSLLAKGVGFLSDKLGGERGLFSRLLGTGEAATQAQGFRVGGLVRAQQGRYLPGYGGGDRVHVLAEAGEFVLRKEAVKNLGLKTVQALNKWDLSGLMQNLSPKIQKFQEGGLINPDDSGDTINVNLKLGNNTHEMRASRSSAEGLLSDIRRMNIVHGRGKRPY